MTTGKYLDDWKTLEEKVFSSESNPVKNAENALDYIRTKIER